MLSNYIDSLLDPEKEAPGLGTIKSLTSLKPMYNEPFCLQEIEFSCVLRTVSIKVAKIEQTKVKVESINGYKIRTMKKLIPCHHPNI